MSRYSRRDNTQFLGKVVKDWEAGMPLEASQEVVYRLRVEWSDQNPGDAGRWSELFYDFLNMPGSDKIEALSIGMWAFEGVNSARTVETLVAARDRLPNLKGMYFGDIIWEENEISWIEQSDLSTLFVAFPQLEHMRIRGGNRLRLGKLTHQNLKSLTIETGGLNVWTLRDVVGADLPKLESLVLWLGVQEYGWNGTIDDLKPLLAGEKFPSLKYLGLCDSEIEDSIAVEAANAPILDRLEVLDLSMGTLGDVGAAALLASLRIKKLKKLDLHHHYCSDEMAAALRKALGAAGVQVDMSDAQEAEVDESDEDDEGNPRQYRYVSVSE